MSIGDACGEEDAFAFRQEVRPTMRVLSNFQLQSGERPRNASLRGNLEQAGLLIECCHDIAVVTPTSAGRGGGIVQRERLAAIQTRFLKLSLRKKTNPLAVRREEGSRCTHRARHLGGLGLVQAAGE